MNARLTTTADLWRVPAGMPFDGLQATSRISERVLEPNTAGLATIISSTYDEAVRQDLADLLCMLVPALGPRHRSSAEREPNCTPLHQEPQGYAKVSSQPEKGDQSSASLCKHSGFLRFVRQAAVAVAPERRCSIGAASWHANVQVGAGCDFCRLFMFHFS